MSLLSLLIVLVAEKSLSSTLWRFNYYYHQYVAFFQNNATLSRYQGTTLSYSIFLLLPVAIVYGLLALVDNGLLHLIISTLILIVCFGCCATRDTYKQYLHAAFRGERTTSELYHQQLLQDKNLPEMSFGQALIWLNYRYYIAIMLFFVVFGAAGVVFYRLLTTVIEQQNGCSLDKKPIATEANNSEALDSTVSDDTISEGIVADDTVADDTVTSDSVTDNAVADDVNQQPESLSTEQAGDISTGCKNYHDILFYLDWLPVRITSFGYMFVGHFSRALPVWLENLFDAHQPTYKVLINVAEKSEDIMVDADDCTAEPCLLVRLAKRNLLLLLAVISILTLVGLIN